MKNKLGYILAFIITFGSAGIYWIVAQHLFYNGWGLFAGFWPVIPAMGLILLAMTLELGTKINNE